MNALANTFGTVEALNRLFARHDAAWAADIEAYRNLGDIDDAMEERPHRRVQISRLIIGRDDEGNNVHKPIYAYTPEGIREQAEKNFKSGSGLFYRRDNEVAMTAARDRWQKWADEKLAELEAIEAEIKRIEDAAGYTAASEIAAASSQACKAIEREIINFYPPDIDAARLKASWIVSHNSDETSYLEDEDILLALKAIAAPVDNGES